MARIELRDATIFMQDGLSGTANISEVTPTATDTDVDVDAVVTNAATTTLIPVGARFTVDTAGNTLTYTVTARTPATTAPTTNVVFTPAWGSDTPVTNDTMTFLPQQIEIKIGEGNITYSEHKDYEYLLDRGNLDTVKENDQVPMDVTLDFVYEFITTGTNETITPMDAVKQKNGAVDWISSSADPCEPYAVDIVIDHNPPCGTAQTETTTFPDFRADDKDVDVGDASINVSGRCNVTEPTVVRS